jgi:hypothetical protein
MAAETKKCAMKACLCMAPAGEKYCSAYCEQAKNETVLECDCGHLACDSQKL